MSQTPDDLLNELDALAEPTTAAKKPSAASASRNSKSTSTKVNQKEHDALADLDQLESLAERPKLNISRPGTPRSGAKRSTERSRTPGSGYGMPPSKRDSGEVRKVRDKQSSAGTPPIAMPRDSENYESSDLSVEQQQQQNQQPSGGWGWGSIWNTAAAAVRTAESVVKEVQNSEEGKKWVTQVKGNADALRGLAGDVRSRALPTFTNLLNHLAPPISSHEQLRIHITHDLQNYPFVNTVVYGVFDRVMQQVEGGDLMVVQRGGSSNPRSSGEGFLGGPWWKAMEKRDLNATHGLHEGVKLARASAEGYSSEHSKTAAAAAAASSVEPPSADNPTTKSNVFLAIQPTIHTPFDGSAEDEEVVSFAIYLLDPEHNISFSTISQALPRQWLEWLDAAPPADSKPGDWALPVTIQEIVDMGGLDPREWVVEWVEEAVGLAVGVVAQKYVAKRMRVGDSGEVAAAVRRAERENAGGEEARAVAM